MSSPYHPNPSLFVFLDSITLGLALTIATHHPFKCKVYHISSRDTPLPKESFPKVREGVIVVTMGSPS
jgi:hypothetical protein